MRQQPAGACGTGLLARGKAHAAVAGCLASCHSLVWRPALSHRGKHHIPPLGALLGRRRAGGLVEPVDSAKAKQAAAAAGRPLHGVAHQYAQRER